MRSKHHILKAGSGRFLLTTNDIDKALYRSVDGRKSFIKRAVKEGSLVRIKPGLYLLSDDHRPYDISPYSISQAICSRSYISMESALSYHGWIPEAVYSTVSVKSGRKSKQFNHETLGQFVFHTIALNRLGFLSGVERVQENNQTWFMATPLRALMDIVAYKKITWQGLEWIEGSLRIDFEDLISIKKQQFYELKNVYKHKNTKEFLTEFERSIY